MRITDLKCAVIGDTPVVRIVTDEGICGYSSVESHKPYLKPHILYYKPYILGEDPVSVERVMLNIRHRGGASAQQPSPQGLKRGVQGRAQRAPWLPEALCYARGFYALRWPGGPLRSPLDPPLNPLLLGC